MPLTDIPVPPTVMERPVVSDLESYWNDSPETGLQFCVFLLSLWHYCGVCVGGVRLGAMVPFLVA